MELMIRNINIEEIGEFTSILREDTEWLKGTDKEMWYTSEFSKEAFLEKNTLKELFIRFLNGESAGTIIA